MTIETKFLRKRAIDDQFNKKQKQFFKQTLKQINII